MSVFTTPKVFDYQRMPEEIQKAVKKVFDGWHNQSYHKFDVAEACKAKEHHKGGEIIFEEDDIIYERGDCTLSDWMMDNGAEQFEEVIVLLWW